MTEQRRGRRLCVLPLYYVVARRLAVDFGVTQVVDGNWGMHASIKKAFFAGETA
jgi:hypothetical protein